MEDEQSGRRGTREAGEQRDRDDDRKSLPFGDRGRDEERYAHHRQVGAMLEDRHPHGYESQNGEQRDREEQKPGGHPGSPMEHPADRCGEGEGDADRNDKRGAGRERGRVRRRGERPRKKDVACVVAEDHGHLYTARRFGR